MVNARADCDAHGIQWLPQRFSPRTKVIALDLSMMRLDWLVQREERRGDIQLIQARSCIPVAESVIFAIQIRLFVERKVRMHGPQLQLTTGIRK